MTDKATPARPCGWCGRPVPVTGTGRPRRYCTTAHRQRAYEARRRGRELGLGPTEVVISRRQLEHVQSRLEALRQELTRVSVTLTGATGTQGYRDALRAVREAAGDLESLWLEPDAVP